MLLSSLRNRVMNSDVASLYVQIELKEKPVNDNFNCFLNIMSAKSG